MSSSSAWRCRTWPPPGAGCGGIDYDDYPFSASEYYSRLRFVSARIHEAAGEIEPAPGLYREVATARTL